ncbi:MAG: hypothetical protein HYR55_08245 [Acidobacteria bacterium]|nr:hypothetical protein [Acidobacteriota bacterium]MBI3657201.1 hypothetical protein [Acidobacteriota bacterium]
METSTQVMRSSVLMRFFLQLLFSQIVLGPPVGKIYNGAGFMDLLSRS